MLVAPGDWVCYGCLDWGPRLFHPDDTRLKESMLAAGAACEVAGEDGEFWVLRFGPLLVRLRKEFVGGTVVPRPSFAWGEPVRVRAPRTQRAGVIRTIGWHAGQQRHLFWIAECGQRIKSRYFAEEMEQDPELGVRLRGGQAAEPDGAPDTGRDIG